METTGSVGSLANDQVAKILLVEDERDVRETIKLQLEDEGHEVSEAESGSDALALAESLAFDLVLTDVMIPGINGIELVQQLNQLDSHPCDDCDDRIWVRRDGRQCHQGRRF